MRSCLVDILKVFPIVGDGVTIWKYLTVTAIPIQNVWQYFRNDLFYEHDWMPFSTLASNHAAFPCSISEPNVLVSEEFFFVSSNTPEVGN